MCHSKLAATCNYINQNKKKLGDLLGFYQDTQSVLCKKLWHYSCLSRQVVRLSQAISGCSLIKTGRSVKFLMIFSLHLTVNIIKSNQFFHLFLCTPYLHTPSQQLVIIFKCLLEGEQLQKHSDPKSKEQKIDLFWLVLCIQLRKGDFSKAKAAGLPNVRIYKGKNSEISQFSITFHHFTKHTQRLPRKSTRQAICDDIQ